MVWLAAPGPAPRSRCVSAYGTGHARGGADPRCRSGYWSRYMSRGRRRRRRMGRRRSRRDRVRVGRRRIRDDMEGEGRLLRCTAEARIAREPRHVDLIGPHGERGRGIARSRSRRQHDVADLGRVGGTVVVDEEHAVCAGDNRPGHGAAKWMGCAVSSTVVSCPDGVVTAGPGGAPA